MSQRCAAAARDEMFARYRQLCQLTPPPDDAGERELVARMVTGDDEARTLLIQGCFRFVFKWARRWESRYDLDFEDLMSAGFEGLTYGATKFEPSQGVKFLSYVGYWVFHRFRQVRGTGSRYRGRSISAELKSDDGDSSNFSLLDMLADPSSPDPAKIAENRDAVAVLMRGLTARQADIIRLYHGLDGTEAVGTQAANILGVSRTRVNQIERTARRKMLGRAERIVEQVA